MKHQDVRTADCEVVQRVIDQGEWFIDSTRHAAGFLEIDGKHWKLVIKSADNGAATYLQSFRRSN